MVVTMLWTPACGWGMSSDLAAEESPAEEESPALWREEAKTEAVDAVGKSAPAVSSGEMPAAEGGEVLVETIAPLATPSPLPMATILPDRDMADGVAVGEMAEAGSAERPVRQAEPLRAGEVDDNALWDDYLLYRHNYHGSGVHDRDVTERYIIEVVDGQGIPVLDAAVRVFAANGQQREEIYAARTYANGQALFHPLALDEPLAQTDRFVVEVQKDNLLEQFTLTRFDAQASTSFTEKWTVTLDTQKKSDSINLEIGRAHV